MATLNSEREAAHAVAKIETLIEQVRAASTIEVAQTALEKAHTLLTEEGVRQFRENYSRSRGGGLVRDHWTEEFQWVHEEVCALMRGIPEAETHFHERVKGATGLDWDSIPVGVPDDIIGSTILCRRGSTYVLGVGYPDCDGVFVGFRRVTL